MDSDSPVDVSIAGQSIANFGDRTKSGNIFTFAWDWKSCLGLDGLGRTLGPALGYRRLSDHHRLPTGEGVSR